MGWLSRWRRTPNPTADWVSDDRRAIEVDLDAHTVNGVAPGDSLRALSWLGPAHVRRHAPMTFEFRELGLQIDTEPDLDEIDGFAVVVEPDTIFPDFQSFPGTISVRGESLPVPQLKGVDDVIRMLGQPIRRDADDDETVLFYEFGRIGREIELTPDGRVKTFRVYRL